uniref:PDZ domain-containing protein n=1 Tax=Entomoneis paludosa TaxID=265537 RepID=A0A7S3DVL5_9STRA|mmetsp:Transcript_4634/g.9873  ORF Transcript_4634/g.9873 Transcript_4634/m.9873 type:complete len:294 (+) Transcript_4634:3-884(+)
MISGCCSSFFACDAVERRSNNQKSSSSPSPTFGSHDEEDSHKDGEDDDNHNNSSIEYSLEDAAAGSFSTVDYDYAKTRDGNSSIVSSVGGTLGELTQKSDHTLTASHRDYSGRLDEAVLAWTEGTDVPETNYFKVQLPADTQQLGMVIHSAADRHSSRTGIVVGGAPPASSSTNNTKQDSNQQQHPNHSTDYPMVHTLKESSPLIPWGVLAGDYLIRVRDQSMAGVSALEVSKIIRSSVNNSKQPKEQGCTLTFLRPAQHPSRQHRARQKSHHESQDLPKVVMTTSSSAEDAV